jgi:hypothetical protein
MLLDGVNHIAWISKDVERLGRSYETVFDAVVGPTRGHGPGETMTTIDIGPVTQLNIFVISGNIQAERQTPIWGRGRIDHIGLAAASPDAFETIRMRLVEADASDGAVTDFGADLACSSAIRTVWKVRFCYESVEHELLASFEQCVWLRAFGCGSGAHPSEFSPGRRRVAESWSHEPPPE